MMVNDPAEYRWSSYQVNGLGKESKLCTPHQEYLALGKNPVERQASYRNLFSNEVEGDLLKEIRENTNKGMAVGNERFKKEIEALTGRRLHPKKGVDLSVGEKIKFNVTLPLLACALVFLGIYLSGSNKSRPQQSI